MQNNSLTFKNRKTSKSEQLANSDIENLGWLRRAKGYCLNVNCKNGASYKFDGFQEGDYQRIDDFATKHLKKSVEKKELSIKGWNWGKPNFHGDSMSFEADGKQAFEIPLKNVSNTNVSKNEAILQFHQNEDASVSLMEIRFHVPSAAAIGSDTDVDDPAQDFIQKVLSHADIQVASDADAICTLTELNCITPRGRYDVKFFTDFVDFHGKTFDYKISYEHILRLFLLPHKDGRQMYFVIAMDPPMKQGNTRYPFLIVLFNIEENISVDLTVSE
jgi:structure-specific recognition protein 1